MKPIAWVVPSLAPASSSRYSASLLLPQLRTRHAIEVFSVAGGTLAGHPVLPIEEFQPERFEALFLQFEAVEGEARVRPLLRQCRSIIWFHDLIGEGGNALTPDDLARSECALFSSFRNIAEFRRGVGEGWLHAAWHLPYPVRIEQSLPDHTRGAVAFAGTPWSESRAEKLFAALALLPGQHPIVWLIDRAEEEGARRLMERFRDQPVQLEFDRSPERWAELVKGAVVAAHLRVSALGDPGPYLPLSWAQGVPTIVSEFAEGEFVLPNCAARISPGVDEVASLQEALAVAIETPERLRAQRSVALDYVREFHHHLCLSAELERLFARLLR